VTTDTERRLRYFIIPMAALTGAASTDWPRWWVWIVLMWLTGFLALVLWGIIRFVRIATSNFRSKVEEEYDNHVKQMFLTGR
jgi:hypothetical protein